MLGVWAAVKMYAIVRGSRSEIDPKFRSDFFIFSSWIVQ